MNTLIGIDWSENHHHIHCMNAHGACIAQFTIKHTQSGFARLTDQVETFGLEPHEVPVAVETAHNLLIDYLWDQRYCVYVVPPSVVSSSRGRFGSSRARTDYSDARLLADLLRTDRARLSRWRPDGTLVRQMRAKLRLIHTLTKTSTRWHHQLRALLLRVYPQAVGLFHKLTAQIALAFLKAYPTPQQARSLSLDEFRAFCQQHRYPAPKRIPGLYARLQRDVPQPDPAVVSAYADQIPFRADILLHVVRRKRQTIRELRTVFEQHDDHTIFDSVPGAGKLLAPSLLIKFGDHRARFREASDVQALAGTCPVTIWSGKKRIVKFRRACDRAFRNIAHQLAIASVSESDWAAMYYQEQRDHGKDTHHAYRCLANRWLGIIWRLWQDRTPYDESYHLQQVMQRRRPRRRAKDNR